ncbi:hypothetical protein O0553_16740, partial [Klebsiella pneumoniae]
KHAYCLKTQPATGETYPKSDLFNKASRWYFPDRTRAVNWRQQKQLRLIFSSYHLSHCIRQSLSPSGAGHQSWQDILTSGNPA